MLLIVFGHISLFTVNLVTGERTFIKYWMYSFHVFVFLILPFIYGYKRKTNKANDKRRFIDVRSVINDFRYSIVKLGVPYCWFFFFSAIVFILTGSGDVNIPGMLYAFIFGEESLLDKYLGLSFLWFLPSMLSLLMLKSVWYNSKHGVKVVILSISILLWVLSVTNVLPRHLVGTCVPFALSQAFYFIILGLISRWIIEKKTPSKLLMVILAIVCSTLIYYRDKLSLPVFRLYPLLSFIMPIIMFLVLYSFRNLLRKCKTLKFIGTYSLQIYLVHVYVINALLMLFNHFLQPSIWLGVVIYVLTFLISIPIALLMVKWNFLNKLLFPIKQD